jgi:hypothetical protein
MKVFLWNKGQYGKSLSRALEESGHRVESFQRKGNKERDSIIRKHIGESGWDLLGLYGVLNKEKSPIKTDHEPIF